MSYQISRLDKLIINCSLIDSHLIDMLIPALNPNTKLILYNCNSLTEAKFEILENLYPFLYQVDIKAKGSLDKSDLIIMPSELDEEGTINDLSLSLILRLIISFSRLINKSEANIEIQNATFQDFQIFSIAKDYMSYIINFVECKIKLPQNKLKINNLNQTIDLDYCNIDCKSKSLLYRQLLKMLGENNYHAIYRLKNFVIFEDSDYDINMLDDLCNIINKRYLLFNLLMLEIASIIKKIGKFNYDIQTNL